MILQPQEGDAAAVSAVGLRHKFRITDPSQPLVLLVHGRAGNFDVMWTFRRAIPDSYSIVAMQAPLTDPIGGFSWWLLGSEGRRVEGAAESAAGLLRSALDRAISFYGLTPPLILGAGFSQGAALISVLLQRPDNPFDGAALLAGLVIPQPDAVKGKTRSVIMLHGTMDEVVPIETARKGEGELRALGYDVQFAEDAVTHKVGAGGVRMLTAWMHGFDSGSA